MIGPEIATILESPEILTGILRGCQPNDFRFRDFSRSPNRSLNTTLGGLDVQPIEVLEYATADRRRPYSEWLQSVRDAKTRLILEKWIASLRHGNLGDFKVFDTLLELRIDYGPGYRIYCGKKGKTFVLLLGGGTKRTQDQDISTAQAYWRDHQARASQHPL